ncbi:Hypothetical predicted protein [Podarcis lilfordi]|uniref:Uncharacterized protein n=1 Tax=Podarcis lilfordi TaxID=74358 RepID=A0AA35KFQ9_9SAUR|nr:Hypothetical predicted protein [Podarcis lilfordi]
MKSFLPSLDAGCVQSQHRELAACVMWHTCHPWVNCKKTILFQHFPGHFLLQDTVVVGGRQELIMAGMWCFYIHVPDVWLIDRSRVAGSCVCVRAHACANKKWRDLKISVCGMLKG